jgi:lysozyme family protein
MASGNFSNCLKVILHHEGGFVNHPRDPGGMTNLGVTKKVYEEWIGYQVSEAIMRKLTPALVSPLYKKRYWDVMKCDGIPRGLDLCVFDFGVNAGTNRSIRYLQRLIGVKEDGIFGPASFKALTFKTVELGANELIDSFQDARRSYYRKLNTFDTFGRGWLRRVDEVEQSAKEMVKK